MSLSINDMVSSLYQALTWWKKDLRPYDVVPLVYNVSGQVNLFRPCNGWTVINKGTTNVTVNGGVVLAPDEFIAIGGNEGEEYTGYLRLLFVSNTDPGNNVLVYQKFYVSGEGKFDKVGK